MCTTSRTSKLSPYERKIAVSVSKSKLLLFIKSKSRDSLKRASSQLELAGGLEVGITGGAVGGGVILEIEKEPELLRKESKKGVCIE